MTNLAYIEGLKDHWCHEYCFRYVRILQNSKTSIKLHNTVTQRCFLIKCTHVRFVEIAYKNFKEPVCACSVRGRITRCCIKHANWTTSPVWCA